MNGARRNLLGLSREELAEFAASIGEARYRGTQLFHWLYGRGITSFGGMTDLGKAFRERLSVVLPKYMLPTVFNRMALMPRNPNGKIDRQKLVSSVN